jgi:EAL domain-containing protein (putative c-di-GMP-specific phosphodiesterase class I)/GGDEF domain-containing protein
MKISFSSLKGYFNESNILKLNVISSIIVITFLVLSLGGFFIYIQYENYKNASQGIAENILASKKERLRVRVEQVLQVIDSTVDYNSAFVKNALIAHIDMAYGIADNIYTKYKGTMSDDRIKGLIIESLRKVSFSIGDSYIWINDLKGFAYMQPQCVQCEGKNMLKEGPSDMIEVVKKEINLLKNNDNAFLTITYKNINRSIIEPHQIYVKKFYKFDWYFGSSIAESAINEYVRKNILNLLMSSGFNKAGDFSVSLFELYNIKGGERFAKVLISPTYPESVGSYLSDSIADLEGSFFRKDYLNQLKKNGYAYITFAKSYKGKPSKKLIYLQLYPKYNWIVSSSTNLDDLYSSIETGKQDIKKVLFNQAAITFLFFIIFGSVALVIAIIFSRIIWHIFDNYKEQIDRRTKQLEFVRDELKKRLYEDDTTGLPSYNKLKEDLEEVKSIYEHFLIGIIHLDNFKLLSNYYGYKVGNFIIKIFSDETTKYFKNYNIKIYRYGEDSLAILSGFNRGHEDKRIKDSAEEFVDYINNRSFVLPEYDFEIDLVVYFVITYDVVAPIEALGLGIDEAKKNKMFFLLYDKFYTTLSYYENTIIWSRKVKSALLDDRIVPFFQPIVNDKGKILSYECLVRLIDENGDIITPGFFLDITKKSNLYTQLTRVMFYKCFNYFRDKQINFSINVNIEDFFDDGCLEYIQKILRDYSDVAQFFTFELVETESISDYELFGKYIKKLKEDFKVKFSIDDFGSGYSNFSHVINLDIDYLKVDGSLVKNLDKDNDVKTLVSSIVYFAKQLEIPTIAEFVHSKEIFEITKDLGFDSYQGYFLGGPQKVI